MPELRETVLLDIAAAQRQITQLEQELAALASPVVVPVEVEGTAAIADLRRQVDSAGGVIDLDVDSAGLDRADAALADVREEIAETGDALRTAQNRAADLRNELNQTSSNGVTAFNNLRAALGPLVATLGAGLGLREAVQQFKAAVDAATALSESVNAVNVVFKDGADEVLAFGENAAQSVGLASSELNQLVTPIGALLGNFNIEGQEASQVTLELATRAADLASVFNTEVPDALAAIGSALRGEQEPIRAYGVALDEAQVAQKALALGLADTASELGTAEKGQARLALILEQSAFAAGDFANTSDEAANKTKILAAEAENARAQLGDKLLPAYESLLEVVPDLLNALEGMGPVFGIIASGAAGAVEPIANITGALGDLIGLVELLPGAAEGEFGWAETLGQLALGPIIVGLDGLVSSIEEFRSEITRGIGVGELEEELANVAEKAAAGAEPVTVLGEAFGRLREDGVDAVDVLEELAQASGVTDQELSTFLVGLIRGGQLAADELRVVRDVLNGLSEVDTGGVNFARAGRGAAEAANDVRELNAAATDLAVSGADRALLNLATGVDAVTEASGALPPFITDLTELQAAADEAGVGILAFRQAVADSDNITIDLSQVETDLLGLISTLGSASFDLRTSIGEAFGVGGTIDEETKKIPDDVAAFLSTLQADIEAQTDFEIDLSKIEVVAPDLAQALADQGIDVAADIAAAFALDPESAEKAQALLDGTSEQLAAGTAEAYAGFLKELTPQQVADLGVFAADNFISPAIMLQLADTADALATDLLSLIDQGISGQSIAPEIIIDLSQARIDLATLPNLAGSPVSVTVPGVPETRTGSTGGGLGGSFGGTDNSVVVNINNPVSNDVTGSGAQAAQQIAAVSRNLWKGK